MSGSCNEEQAAVAQQHPVEKRQTIASSWKMVFTVALKISVYACFIGTVASALYLLVRDWFVDRQMEKGRFINFLVNTTSNELVILWAPEKGGAFEKWLGFQVTAATQVFLPIPFSFLLYAKFSWQHTCTLLVACYVGTSIFYILDDYGTLVNLPMLKMLEPLIPFSMFGMTMHFIIPSDSSLSWQYFKLVTVVLLGLIFVESLRKIPIGDQFAEIMNIFVWFPIVREFSYYLGRDTSRIMALQNVGGEGLSVDRDAVWSIFLPYQVIISVLVRLSMTNIEDTAIVVIVVLGQSLMELFLRLTLHWRDEKLKNINLWSKCRRSKRRRITLAVTAPSAVTCTPMTNTIRMETSQEAEILSRKGIVSMLLTGEMVAEYCAIVITPIMLLQTYPHRLRYPFDYYAIMDNPFGNHMDAGPMFSWLLIQLLSELVVDVICLKVEIGRGYAVNDAWKYRYKYMSILVIVATMFGISSARAMAARANNYDNCWKQDMCYCAGSNGIRPGSIVDLYCLKLYNETKGLPT